MIVAVVLFFSYNPQQSLTLRDILIVDDEADQAPYLFLHTMNWRRFAALSLIR